MSIWYLAEIKLIFVAIHEEFISSKDDPGFSLKIPENTTWIISMHKYLLKGKVNCEIDYHIEIRCFARCTYCARWDFPLPEGPRSMISARLLSARIFSTRCFTSAGFVLLISTSLRSVFCALGSLTSRPPFTSSGWPGRKAGWRWGIGLCRGECAWIQAAFSA